MTTAGDSPGSVAGTPIGTEAESPDRADAFRFEDFEIQETTPSRRHWLRWLVAAGIVVAAAAAAIWVLDPFGSTAASPVTATATKGTIISSVNLSGSVASSIVKELDFGASGAVTAVNVAVGEMVTEGEVLATIDGTTLQAQLATAKANLAAAQARLVLDRSGPTAATIASARDSITQAKLQLRTALQSLSDTYAQNTQSIAAATAAYTAAKDKLASDKASLPAGDPQLAIDQTAVDDAAAALNAAKLKASVAVHQATSQVDSARLGVTVAEDNYALKVAPATSFQIASDEASVASAQEALATLEQSATVITSPINGTVTAVNVVVGQQVTGGSAASSSSSSASTTGQIEVMDLAKLQVVGQASETDIANLKMGQAATITAAALGSDTLVGTVCARSIVGTQISGVTSYGVTVCLNGANSKLLIGMSVTAAVVADRADGAVLVPSLAVKTVGGQQVVTVLGSDGKTETNVPVQVGITNGSETQIVSGIPAGTVVVETLQTTTQTRGGGGVFRQFPGAGFGGG